MKTSLATAALLVLALSFTAEAVHVQEGEFSISLESVRRLQELMESRRSEAGKPNPRIRTSPATVCADPVLPQEFVPLCQENDASMIVSKLAMVPLDICEICAFAACAGC